MELLVIAGQDPQFWVPPLEMLGAMPELRHATT